MEGRNRQLDSDNNGGSGNNNGAAACALLQLNPVYEMCGSCNKVGGAS